MNQYKLPTNRVYLSQGVLEPAISHDKRFLFFVKQADGRRALLRQDLTTGLQEILSTEHAPGGGVGYGGGLFSLSNNRVVYAARNKLVLLDLESSEERVITPQYEGVSCPVFSPCGRFVAFLAEEGGRCNVLLVATTKNALPIKISDDPWYAFNPTFSDDGKQLAWQEWDRAHMPWTESRLVVASFARPTESISQAYEVFPSEKTLISQNNVAITAASFRSDGSQLAYLSDESGYRSLYLAGPRGESPRRIDTGLGELGGPEWVPGKRRLHWHGDDIYTTRRHHSRDTICRIETTSNTVEEIALPVTEIDMLSLGKDCLAFWASEPTKPPALYTFDFNTRELVCRASSGVGMVNAEALVQPRVISWQSGGEEVFGVFYQAAKTTAPLLVHIHGGPTAERSLGWDAQAQFFATRGFHYLSVNHRGSTGFGRRFQDLLQGQWGVVDVEDARSGAELLVREGLADKERLVILGGSAGGYTTLRALTVDAEFWAAGISLYGIGNLYDLKQGSHRFEANYEEGLIGPLPENADIWRERSPLKSAHKLRAALLLFHGKDDKAVPYQQSVEFADVAKRQGCPVELVLYEEEGHGFGKEKTRQDLLQRMEKFLDKYVVCKQG